MTAAVEELPLHLRTPGYHPQGLPQLREEIAAWYVERGLPTTPEQIIVMHGALAATALAIRAVAEFGDRVLVESPTHPNSIDAIRCSGHRIVPAPMVPDGWDLSLLETTVRQTAPRAAWMVVDFQNPTGHLMPPDDRAALADVFTRSRVNPIVDETLAALTLDDPATPPPFASYAPDTVVTVGSMSKSFWGGLRIGWLRVPLDLVARMLDTRASMDLGAPVVEQLAAVHLLRERARILPERLQDLRVRRAALVAALREYLPSWRFTVPSGGLSIWCELPAPVGSTLVGVAESHGVLLMAGSRFAPDGGLERHMRLPYTLEPEELTEAVRRIAAAYEQVMDGATGVARRRAAMIA